METCDPTLVQALGPIRLSQFLLPSYRLNFDPGVPLEDAILVGEETLESGDCYVLESTAHLSFTKRFWILKSNFTILQAAELYIRNGAERARSDRELAQRERKMSRLLNRPAIELPEPESYEDEVMLTKYEYFDVIFDAPLVETVFEFPAS